MLGSLPSRTPVPMQVELVTREYVSESNANKINRHTVTARQTGLPNALSLPLRAAQAHSLPCLTRWEMPCPARRETPPACSGWSRPILTLV